MAAHRSTEAFTDDGVGEGGALVTGFRPATRQSVCYIAQRPVNAKRHPIQVTMREVAFAWPAEANGPPIECNSSNELVSF